MHESAYRYYCNVKLKVRCNTNHLITAMNTAQGLLTTGGRGAIGHTRKLLTGKIILHTSPDIVSVTTMKMR